jgi:hypothetical protein
MFLALAGTPLCAQQEGEEVSLRIAALGQEAMNQCDQGSALDLVQRVCVTSVPRAADYSCFHVIQGMGYFQANAASATRVTES